MSEPIQVFLLDDHRVVRAGLRSILAEYASIEVVGECGTPHEALQEIQKLQPHVVLLDIRLGQDDGCEFCGKLKKLPVPPRVLMLTSYADEEVFLRALSSGADGYILKDTREAALAAAITAVFEGGTVWGRFAAQLLKRMSGALELPALCEVCILAGGLSSRMGRDKTRLRLGGKPLLAHARAAAAALHSPIRVIRRDLVARCGPIGGVYTALKTTRARHVLFLSCDMPFVPSRLLRRLILSPRSKVRAAFTRHERSLGFPFLLSVEMLPTVEKLLRLGRFALQDLAAELKAKAIQPARREAALLLNVNTPEDWLRCRELWTRTRSAENAGQASSLAVRTASCRSNNEARMPR